MKTTALEFFGACAAALAAAAGMGAPLEAGLGINGNVRVGGKGAQLAMTIHHEGWSGQSTGIRSDFAFPDVATGTANFELFADKARSGHGSATLLPTADRRAVYANDIQRRVGRISDRSGLPVAAHSPGSNGLFSRAAGHQPRRRYDFLQSFCHTVTYRSDNHKKKQEGSRRLPSSQPSNA